MKLEIKIDSDNVACSTVFQVNTILRNLSFKINHNLEEIKANVHRLGYDEGKIMDINGNSVGTWKMEK